MDPADELVDEDYLSKQTSVAATYRKLTAEQIEAYAQIEYVSNGVVITFNENAFEQQFLILSKQYFHKVWDVADLDIGNTNNSFISGKIMCTLSLPDLSGTTSLPYIQDGSFIVYLNGRELANGIDFTVVRKTTGGGSMMYYMLCIQNASYLTAEGPNRVEAYIASESTFGITLDYQRDGKVISFEPLVHWYDGLSQISVDGRIVDEVTFEDGYIVIPDTYQRPGAPIQIRSLCSTLVKEFVDGYMTDIDTSRIYAILQYFRLYAHTIPPIEIIPYSHKVYSITVNEVLKDALAGNIQLLFDPVPERMDDQVVAYHSLKQYDAAFQYRCECGRTVGLTAGITCPYCTTSTARSTDLRYVDILPSYKLHSGDVQTYNTILQLMRGWFSDDKITDGGTVNG